MLFPSQLPNVVTLAAMALMWCGVVADDDDGHGPGRDGDDGGDGGRRLPPSSILRVRGNREDNRVGLARITG